MSESIAEPSANRDYEKIPDIDSVPSFCAIMHESGYVGATIKGEKAT
jgi:hypothetical protein